MIVVLPTTELGDAFATEGNDGIGFAVENSDDALDDGPVPFGDTTRPI